MYAPPSQKKSWNSSLLYGWDHSVEVCNKLCQSLCKYGGKPITIISFSTVWCLLYPFYLERIFPRLRPTRQYLSLSQDYYVKGPWYAKQHWAHFVHLVLDNLWTWADSDQVLSTISLISFHVGSEASFSISGASQCLIRRYSPSGSSLFVSICVCLDRDSMYSMLQTVLPDFSTTRCWNVNMNEIVVKEAFSFAPVFLSFRMLSTLLWHFYLSKVLETQY